ncbi:MAG TPA: branched-chain amino acid ABC transporter permease [Solirubrobacterales bacterium]
MTLFWQLVLNGLVAGALYALVAVGFALIFGCTRHFHIAHAGVLATGGYLCFALVDRAGLPILLAGALAIAASTLLGVVILRGVYRPLERRGGEGFVLFLVSLGALILIENTFTLWLGASSVTVDPGEALKDPIRIGSVSLTAMQIGLIVVSFAAFAALMAILVRTSLGKDIRALAANPELVRILGGRPDRIQTAVYALASAIVALAGVYQVADTGMQPGVGTNLIIFAFVAVILGGIGSVGGAFAAAMLLGLLQNVSQLVIPSEWSTSVVFVMFLALITLLPSGLATLKSRRAVVLSATAPDASLPGDALRPATHSGEQA